ncbi:sigma-70 family RNA polymerase sigma factor [Paenarthrobacter nitroguajacolicus]|uniref:sigma-70 family RNA polymerase sigma factor n=1 Tax=Paenarthrobacter nitroguajacolicus TaxID=211146 RepID=UPI002119548C|nr:sigma-70 family RNA polymerase sigma factor [Paenarthrobacter nitroguajacolicus]
MAQSSHAGSKSKIDDDGRLIELVRGGDMSAFDGLYERHVSIASTVARRNVDNPSDAEDVVAEAFQAVLQGLVAGRGPDTFFRAYLLSTVTRLSHQRNRKAGKVLPSSDDSVLDHALADSDAAINAFESRTVAKAFRTLPERWQAVLWYLDVERMKPAAVAPILGLSPNAVSALALRAREGLRRQYLQCHIAEQPDGRCSEFASKLGNFIRGGLSAATERKVRDHLNGCSTCTAALAELKDVQGSMRAVLLPMVTGVPITIWAGKGAGLGVLGAVFPAKAALIAPALAQPIVLAVVAAAGVGLVLGSIGIVDHLTPETYSQQRALQTGSPPWESEPATPTATPTTSSTPFPASSSPTELPPAPEELLPTPVEVPSGTQVPTLPQVMPAQNQTAEPSATPSLVAPPAPTPAPALAAGPRTAVPADVQGSVRQYSGRDAVNITMEIDFQVSGANPLGSGKAVFSVAADAWIEEGSLQAPVGWTCALESRRVAICASSSVQRGDLQFRVLTDSQGNKKNRELSYTLSGPGLAPNNFTYNY